MSNFRGADSMVMIFNGNVDGDVRGNFLALLSRNPTFSCVVPSHSSELFGRERSPDHCHSKSFLVPEIS